MHAFLDQEQGSIAQLTEIINCSNVILTRSWHF